MNTDERSQRDAITQFGKWGEQRERAFWEAFTKKPVTMHDDTELQERRNELRRQVAADVCREVR